MEALIMQHGTKWTTIAKDFERLHSKRTTCSLRNRWQRIQHARRRVVRKSANQCRGNPDPRRDRRCGALDRARIGRSVYEEKENDGRARAPSYDDSDYMSDSDSTVADNDVGILDADVDSLADDDDYEEPAAEPVEEPHIDDDLLDVDADATTDESAVEAVEEGGEASHEGVDGVPQEDVDVFRAFGAPWQMEPALSAWGEPVCIATADLLRVDADGISFSADSVDQWLNDAEVSRWVYG